jgi:outer membrane protein OmpA-like peptidoglycan-associated protein
VKKIVLNVLLLLSVFCTGFAQSAGDFEVLQKPDNTITITGYSGSPQAVVVPEILYGQTVNEIGSSAFFGKTDLRSVVLPDSVRAIGTSAFARCGSLQNVTFGASLASIGDNAFLLCGIVRVSLPASLRSIGNSAFASNKLSAVVIPDSVERIGVDAFSNNTGLSRVALGSGIQNIYFNAFGSGEDPVTQIAVKKAGIDLGGINLDQNFVNVYANGGPGVYTKEGNAWVKEDTDINTFISTLNVAAAPVVPPGASIQNTPVPPSVSASSGPVTVPDDPLGRTWIIYFGSNGASLTSLSRTLSESNKAAFETVAAILEKYPSYRVRITGYANPLRPTAREERNVLVPLSLNRARAAAAMLEFYGVASRRMAVVGAGSANPIAGYNNRADWYRNRRVELTVIR